MEQTLLIHNNVLIQNVNPGENDTELDSTKVDINKISMKVNDPETRFQKAITQGRN